MIAAYLYNLHLPALLSLISNWTFLLFYQINDNMADWQAKAKEKAQSVLNLIPKEWRLDTIPSSEEQRDVTGSYIQQYLNSNEIEITETDAVGIVEHTTSGQWTAVEVAKAFCHRAAIAHQLVNCLHEIFFDAAIEEAENLDAHFKKHGKPVGPLHGLPVSLKDQFHVKGVETHMVRKFYRVHRHN